MIAVNSYPELFTTLLGWQQYQSLWSIIVKTGLAFVPFIVMIITNTAEPFLSQSAKSAYLISLRRVEYALVTMIIVIMIACQPMMSVTPQVLHFKPACQSSINATPGNSGTTYDEAFSNLPTVKVPLWWYAVMSLSGGLTASANVGLGCVPNLREERVQLHLERIKSAPLRLETEQFIQACWLPAWRKYNQDKPNISQYTEQYGSTDPEWAGSHAFLNLPGYYDSLRAPQPIQGFPYNKQRDWVQGSNHGQWGTPTCTNWWQKPAVGLHDQLKAQIAPTLWQKGIGKATGRNPADSVIQALIGNSLTAGYREDSGVVEGMGAPLITGFMAGVGLAWHGISYYPKMYVLIEALPIIQAYLLMACYIFLAIALPASRYKFSTVSSITFVIFSIIFWSYIWALAKYVDTAMLHALDPMGGFRGIAKDYGGTEGLTDMVAILMYIILPIFWTMFMGWAGIQVGNGATGMVDRAAGISSGAGAAAGGIASKGVSRLASKIR